MHHLSTPLTVSFSTSRCILFMELFQIPSNQLDSPTAFLVSSSKLFQIISSSPCMVSLNTMTSSWRGCLLNQWPPSQASPKSLWTWTNSSKRWDTTEGGLTLALWQPLHSQRVSSGMCVSMLSHSVKRPWTCSSTSEGSNRKTSSTSSKTSINVRRLRPNYRSSQSKWSHLKLKTVKRTSE